MRAGAVSVACRREALALAGATERTAPSFPRKRESPAGTRDIPAFAGVTARGGADRESLRVAR